MKNCMQCGQEIPYRIKIDGVYKNLQKRKYCLNCSPFGKHNTRKLETKTKNSKRTIEIICINCNEDAIISINSKGKYCTIKCQNDYQNKQYIERWLAGLETGNVFDNSRICTKINSRIKHHV